MDRIEKVRRFALRPYTKLKRFVRDEIVFLPRRLGSEERALPDYLILGAMKCGTTSLLFYLNQHPQILAAYKKEVRYFSVHYQRGEAWYRAHFPRVLALCATQSSERPRVITGEATPDYLFHPHIPMRVHESVPKAHLIAILRNPVERAFSHYNHNRRAEHTFGQNREPLDFLDALEAEERRLAGERERMLGDPDYNSMVYSRYSYMKRGVYIDQLVRYAELFGKEFLLVLRSEDFYNNPQSVYDTTTDFLRVDRYTVPNLTAMNVNRYSNMDPQARKYLERFFAPYNERLSEFLGYDLQWS